MFEKGVNGYNPTEAYDAYRSIFKGKINLGIEPPPEAWGGNMITADEVQKMADHVTAGADGLFFWSLQKSFKNGTMTVR